jgi:hypothetical protein
VLVVLQYASMQVLRSELVIVPSLRKCKCTDEKEEVECDYSLHEGQIECIAKVRKISFQPPKKQFFTPKESING